MKEIFEKTINVLKNLNEFKRDSIYSNDEVTEEKDNIDDINKIEERFNNAIDCLNNIDKNEEDEVVKKLIDLHLVYSDFIWQYEEMHEMIKKSISRYRDK